VIVDWKVVATVAHAAAADPPGITTPPRLEDQAVDAAARIVAVTGMRPQAPLPPVEWVSRRSWVDANLTTMSALLDPVLAKASLPRAATPLGRSLATGAVALEVGALLGMLSRRVLGQVEVNMLDETQPPRLLMVAPNLEAAAARMDVDQGRFVTWVLLHEVTHAVQFTSVPWLRPQLGDAMRELLELADIKLSPGALAGGVRGLAGAIREGGLIGALVGPQKRALMARVQGTMGLVEGHAEWAMDAAGEDAVPGVKELRSKMTRRRADRAPLFKLLDRLLGFDLKMRQYEQGKAFCDAVERARGRRGIDSAWESADAAPTLSELADPASWLARRPAS